MRVYSLLYKNNRSLKNFIVNNGLSGRKKYLIKIHTDSLLKAQAQALVEYLKELMPLSEVIGCSVGGVIYKGKSLEDQTLISFIDCYDSEIITTTVELKEGDDYKSPEQVADEILWNLHGIDGGFLFAFYTPDYHATSQVIDQLSSRAKDFRVIGGGAYSPLADFLKAPAYIIDNTGVAESCFVVAKLSGHLLLKTQASATGISSIGRTYKVTKSKGHHLLEIDRKPAKQWFNHLVGEEHIKNNMQLVDAFPIVRKRDEHLGLNAIYDVNIFTGEPLGDTLFTLDEVKVGEELTAGVIEPTSAMSNIKELCGIIENSPSEALFAYSCLARRHILHNCAQWELQPFYATQIAGAFMAGELIWDGKACKYSNSAFTVAALSEDEKATVNLNLSILEDSGSIQFDNLYLVNYMFSTANSELKNEIKESEQKLTEHMITDSDTGLPNLAKYIYDNDINEYNSMCLLSLKNENIVRYFLSKNVRKDYIASMVQCCRKVLGEEYHIYLYDDLSLIITTKTDDRAGFVAKMQQLKKNLAKVKNKNYDPIFEMSIAFGEDDLLKRTEITCLNLHKGTGDFLVYYEEESENNFNREMQILQVINDAISYGRVLPYYQGIRNNNTNQIEICEALMRITDAGGKVYHPNDFISVAKEYKLYDRLSKMMIEKVFEEADRHSFKVSMNLNVQDIYNREILAVVFNNLKAAKDPGKFIFEIVEGEEITDYDYLHEFTNKIHSLGGKIAIDDFGSGYSNLLHVLKIDVDYLKITGEIVKDLCEDDSCQEFVSMIANWANIRNKNVVAEYVENEAIQSKLDEYKVAYSQGYLFSKPHRLA